MPIEKKVKNNPIVMGDIKAIKGWIVGEEKGVPNYDKNSLVLHKKAVLHIWGTVMKN